MRCQSVPSVKPSKKKEKEIFCPLTRPRLLPNLLSMAAAPLLRSCATSPPAASAAPPTRAALPRCCTPPPPLLTSPTGSTMHEAAHRFPSATRSSPAGSGGRFWPFVGGEEVNRAFTRPASRGQEATRRRTRGVVGGTAVAAPRLRLLHHRPRLWPRHPRPRRPDLISSPPLFVIRRLYYLRVVSEAPSCLGFDSLINGLD